MADRLPAELAQGERARLFPVLATTSKEGRTTSIVPDFHTEVRSHLGAWKRSAPKIKRERQDAEDVTVEGLAEDAEDMSNED
ncbi:hypothetical protein N8I71_17400 [Roseibacterium sp. SDUM158016]|jgi:hypothetical protein|uniref:hypothetical protein n=1 Tax=Roseicyclus sediminis TaxID=2980997 RepID=UPI0021CE934C|nr:hypothetical protein [Roseibacterium sp. SDUM158016]MCU4654619.1 hypothetical protein [Roseibacterium sp. SDUM158016]